MPSPLLLALLHPLPLPDSVLLPVVRAPLLRLEVVARALERVAQLELQRARQVVEHLRVVEVAAVRVAHLVVEVEALAHVARQLVLELEEAEEARKASEEGRLALEEELNQLRAEVAAARKANQAVPDPHDYDEAATRDAFIDLLLAEAGWPLDAPRDREFPVQGMPNQSGEGFVDYVLWGSDGKPLAVVEAKRTKKDARIGQQQAKLYADCLERMYGTRPVIFCTNGYEHWIWDDQMYPPRVISGFLKKDELELLHQRRTTRKPLDQVPLDDDIAGRFYQ